jgi:metal-sulfur cluster biosynthetic enzyme/nitrite reductase/ring-hydroxylating ferredoxin subunit
MADFEQVASVDEIKSGERLSVFYDDDIPILLVQNEDGTYQAVEDVCSHDGQPLTDGPIENGEIVCPRHGARFDLKTGAPTCMPATSGIATFEVKVEDGEILLRPREEEEVVRKVETTTPVSVPTTEADSSCCKETAGAVAEAGAGEPPATCEESGDAGEEKSLDEKMIEALKTVIDPELMINIVDLGLIYSVNHDGQNAYVDMTLTSPACPAGPQIVQQAKMSLERLHLVDNAEIKLVMTPPWTPERMTDEARDHLGIF